MNTRVRAQSARKGTSTEERVKDRAEVDERRVAREKELKAQRAQAEAKAKEKMFDRKRDKFSKFKADLEKDFQTDDRSKSEREQQAKKLQNEEAERKERANAHKVEIARNLLEEKAIMMEHYVNFKEDWERLKTAKTGALTLDDFMQWAEVREGNAGFVARRDDAEVRKTKMREATLRWHPDKFNATFGKLIQSDHVQSIQELVQQVSQQLAEQRKVVVVAK
ncbi:hypothetical protein CYMTET_23534 [Cymbomonas tetramitiformis]|uniref:Uncharacterized protein n=1 Tax=Cymbomonas tetramitiformis TaxID=36881 RepID=A0AAE0FY85_9CHLO|nr:hypothetical protein CYMTET_23534 [Cymbomonas tetramitiformis]